MAHVCGLTRDVSAAGRRRSEGGRGGRLRLTTVRGGSQGLRHADTSSFARPCPVFSAQVKGLSRRPSVTLGATGPVRRPGYAPVRGVLSPDVRLVVLGASGTRPHRLGRS